MIKEKMMAFTDGLAAIMGADEPEITLRDYFAGQAIVGLADGDHVDCSTTAKIAYELADAMIAERKATQTLTAAAESVAVKATSPNAP